MIDGRIIEVIGFEPYFETDTTERNISKITGIVRYTVEYKDGSKEELVTTLRPGENFGWSLKVIEAAQAWRDSGGVIPEWTPPTPEELRELTPPLSARRFRLGLLNDNRSPSEVDAIIAAIPDQAEREKAETEWLYATEFQRTHPLVVSLSAALGYTPEQVDALWEQARSL